MARTSDVEQVKKFIEVLEDAGYEPQSYSGRSMYGKHCVSVSGNGITAWKLAKDLFSEVHDGEFSHLPEPRQDQLGRGIVLYWPEYEWPKEADNG